jgi:hypothetical protein
MARWLQNTQAWGHPWWGMNTGIIRGLRERAGTEERDGFMGGRLV